MRASIGILITSIILSSGSSVLAADRTKGQVGKAGDAPRAAATLPPAPNAKPLARPTFDPRAYRKAVRSVEDAKRAFTLVGRTRDGKEVRKVPGDDVIRAIMGEKAPGEKQGAIDVDEDPVIERDGQGRKIVGKDNRVRVGNADDYPYSAMGYMAIDDPTPGQNWSYCAAALISPRIIITAATCLYNHGWGDEQDDGWSDNFEFWPALNGEDHQPYGSATYDTAYVFDGWITEYDGTWDSVAAYDVGLVVLDEPIGDSTGYLGYWSFGDDADSLDAYLVGYFDDKKPAFSMWRSRCEIANADILDFWYLHDCDSYYSKGPMFVYDKGEDQRYVVGVDVGETPDGRNFGVRLYGAVYEWMSSIDQE